MSSSIIRKLNRQLEQGILPPELDFSKRPDDIDWEKVRYNTFYRSPEFVASRFPDKGAGFLNIPGGELILKSMANRMTSPLDEMLVRQKSKCCGNVQDDEEGDVDETKEEQSEPARRVEGELQDT